MHMHMFTITTTCAVRPRVTSRGPGRHLVDLRQQRPLDDAHMHGRAAPKLAVRAEDVGAAGVRVVRIARVVPHLQQSLWPGVHIVVGYLCIARTVPQLRVTAD